MAPEFLDGPNCYECPKCNEAKKGSAPQRHPAMRWLSIKQPPQILVLHLKRFAVVGHTCKKLKDIVSFETSLSLQEFSSAARDARSNDPKKETPAGSLADAEYELAGVVEHSGNLNSGEATAKRSTSSSRCNASHDR